MHIKNAPNGKHYVCSICNVSGQYEQHCHVAMYQFLDLSMLFEVHLPQYANTTTNTTEVQENNENNWDSPYF